MNNLSRLLVSVLVFKSTENVINLFGKFPSQLAKEAKKHNFNVDFVVRVNNPQLKTENVVNLLHSLKGSHTGANFTLCKEDHNLGFGGGHNKTFENHPSDIFLILNDDLGIPHTDWLGDVIARFQSDPKLAAIGEAGNPQDISSVFSNGQLKTSRSTLCLKYAEASILFVRSSAFREVGLFTPEIDWAMTEDSDLSLKLQQQGFTIDWMDFPHQHWRSTSFNSIPGVVKSSILEHNRANFFANWRRSMLSAQPGQLKIFDVYSDGLGDTFCALCQLAVYCNGLTPQRMAHIVVNSGNKWLAELFLPASVEVVSHTSSADLERIFFNRISTILDLRKLNYASPFNLHALCAGELNLPLAGSIDLFQLWSGVRHKLPKIAERFSLLPRRAYCILHLDFFRKGHDGRMLDAASANQLIELVNRSFQTVVLVGTAGDGANMLHLDGMKNIADMRGQTDLGELISLISSAAYFVGIDSFPAHVAQISKVPSSIIFGSVHPLMRVFDTSRVWPIVEPVPCIGCYHEQIEPGVPFCMRMDSKCMSFSDINAVENKLKAMIGNVPHDWRPEEDRFRTLQTKFLRLVRHHPAGASHFSGRQKLPNEAIAESLYSVISTFSNLVGPGMQDAKIHDLENELKRVRLSALEMSQESEQLHERTVIKMVPTESTSLVRIHDVADGSAVLSINPQEILTAAQISEPSFARLSDEAFLREAYSSLLGRAPDAIGEKSYLARLREGVPRMQVWSEIASADEASRFASRHAPTVSAAAGISPITIHSADDLLLLDGSDFVRAAYRVILGREVDSSGLRDSLLRLSSGTSELQLLADLRCDPEGQAYASPLAGLDELVRRVQERNRGVRVNSLAELLLLHGEPFVRAAYLTLLKREPDPQGLARYLEVLRAGHSNMHVLKALYQAPEARDKSAELPGLAAAIRNYDKARPRSLKGWYYRSVVGAPSDLPRDREIRALAFRVTDTNH